MRDRNLIILVIVVGLCSINSAKVLAHCPSADLTDDCFVNFEDLAVISDQWLNGYDCNDANTSTDEISIDNLSITADDIPIPPDYNVSSSSANLTAWYANFDALPYKEKLYLGTDETDTYSLYEYRFGNTSGMPVLLTHHHGSEMRPIASLYWLAKCVCYSNTPLFRWMRKYCDVRIIPTANPYGFVNETRKNGNLTNPVDLNRNYDWRWGYNTNTGSSTYAGTAAESEAETVAVAGRMLSDYASTPLPRPLLFIDCHDTGASTNLNIYVGLPNYQLPINRKIAKFMIGQDDTSIGYLDSMLKEIDPNSGIVLDCYNSGRYYLACGFSTNYAASQGMNA